MPRPLTCAPTLSVIALVLLSPAPSHAQAAPPSCPVPLASIGADGRAIAGDKAAVLAAAGAGLPLRVGWSVDGDRDGRPDVTHWADAGFVTEFEGEAFAQLADIQRQQLLRGRARVALPPGRQRWSGLIGTTGILESHFEDPVTPPQSVPVASTWCVDPRVPEATWRAALDRLVPAGGCAAPAWRLVYRHDADGAPLAGRKDALLDAVRRGVPIRFAWGFEAAADGRTVSAEHAAEPVFVTIMDGREVVVQLPEHIAQRSYVDPAAAGFEAPSVMWRGLMSTTGEFDAVYVDRASGAEVRRLPQRAGLAWFAFQPPADCAPAPLVLAVPGGARRR